MDFRVAIVLCIVWLSLGCDAVVQPTTAVTPAAFNPAGAPTVEFTLPDMMCEDGCAMTVKDILERQPGVKDVAVDFEGKTATVAIDESAFDSEHALAELVDKGFLESALARDGPPATVPSHDVSAQPAAAASSPSD